MKSDWSGNCRSVIPLTESQKVGCLCGQEKSSCQKWKEAWFRGWIPITDYLLTVYFLDICLPTCLFLPYHLSLFISALSSALSSVLWSLAGLMLNAHPLPFHEGQMCYFRLVPSYNLLWKMDRGLFHILVSLLQHTPCGFSEVSIIWCLTHCI